MLLTGQSLIQVAAKLSAVKHEGQFRHDGITPFVTHPQAVAARFEARWKSCLKWKVHYLTAMENGRASMADQYARGMALCHVHDLIEDQRATFDDLHRAGLGVLKSGLNVLTRQPTQSYLSYILGIRDYRSISWLPFLVKLCDIEHNLSDQPTKAQVTKYEMARWILTQPQP